MIRGGANKKLTYTGKRQFRGFETSVVEKRKKKLLSKKSYQNKPIQWSESTKNLIIIIHFLCPSVFISVRPSHPWILLVVLCLRDWTEL